MPRCKPRPVKDFEVDPALRHELRDHKVAHTTPALGVIRLDYDYPSCVGDVDHPKSFTYLVVYRPVKGLTFDMCQSGKLSPEVRVRLHKVVKAFDKQKQIRAISGDCGFFYYFQEEIRKLTSKPVFMSSLCILPSLVHCLPANAQVAVFTANKANFKPMLPLLQKACTGVVAKNKIKIVDCSATERDAEGNKKCVVPGFEAVEEGKKVDTERVNAGMVKLARNIMENNPKKIAAMVLECTELPAYGDSLRYELLKEGKVVPVYDAISVCNGFMMGLQDNATIGINYDRSQQGRTAKRKDGPGKDGPKHKAARKKKA